MPDYPNSIVTLPTVEGRDLSQGKLGDNVKAEDQNKGWREIEAIETELGTLPKGSFADVKTRLNDVDSKIDSVLKLTFFGKIITGSFVVTSGNTSYWTLTIPSCLENDIIYPNFSCTMIGSSASQWLPQIRLEYKHNSTWTDFSKYFNYDFVLSINQCVGVAFGVLKIPSDFSDQIRVKLTASVGNINFNDRRIYIPRYRNATFTEL